MTDHTTRPLAELTTLGVGGSAHRLLEPATRDELITTLLEVWGEPEEWLLLGGGSNLLIGDEGIDGTVVRVATRGITRLPGVPPRLPEPDAPNRALADAGPERLARQRTVRLRVEAGEAWDDVVAYAVEHGFAGIEALSGIPGSAGAAPVQNIGAYGQELASSLAAIEFLDYLTGEVSRIPAAELGLGYRTSALKRGRLGAVLSLELALFDAESSRTGDRQPLSAPIAYAQLADALGVRLGDRVPVAELRSAVLRLRGSKGMLWDPQDPDSRSAGSFFTNPVVSENFARGLPESAPRWPTAPEERSVVVGAEEPVPALARGEDHDGGYRVKLSAAWLIEHSGITRGFALPGSRAAISSKHTLAIVNRGGATAREVAQLAGFVRTRVLSEFGVALHPEPVLVGVEL